MPHNEGEEKRASKAQGASNERDHQAFRRRSPRDHARGQVHGHRGEGLHERHAGAGSPADGADAPRPRGGPQHRRPSFPAIAGRRSAASISRSTRRRSISKAHDIVFQPGVNEDLAATAVWGSQNAQLSPGVTKRRRARHLVRQGPGRRPLRRRVQARQFLRHLAAWRRAGDRGRRSQRQVLHRRAPVGPCLHGGDHADAVSLQRAGIRRARPARHRHEPLCRPVGRATR